ncbi:hypothetical protein SAMN05421796_11077 [Chryseobacterium piscicola]|uniref:Outer membrane protein beta-barrel domain-containing protein n=1 Tax=Chryseobacterium piscicola TaxID=551459 RepID=A0A1N7P1B9_9FLAO|nr:hypothetical protein [Chryseobacterium piscicola]PQA92739.1 hypothetical protein B0A70_10160 [Chryseobacterium piscicola]SIT04435.1 hypothetical protein SAMN05421796_11077 [Chryseobacterium piscicola]
MKKVVLLGFFALLGNFAQAQEGFKLGGHIGAPVGDASEIAAFTLGFDAAYMWNITKGLDVGLTSGYSHFFGKDRWEDFGFIPLAASGKYRFNGLPLFVGLDLGGAISTKDGINSGIYVYPKVGFQLPKAELYLGYQNVGSERGDWERRDRRIDSNFGAINLGVNFFIK